MNGLEQAKGLLSTLLGRATPCAEDALREQERTLRAEELLRHHVFQSYLHGVGL